MKLDEYLKDYKSLYPSIVKTFKLSNESIVGIINKKQLITLCSIAKAFKIDDLSYVFKEILPKYLSYDPEVMYAVEHYEQTDKYDKKFDIKNISNGFKIDIEYYPLYDNGVFQNKFENLKEFISWLKDNNFALMPNGVVVDQNREDAIIAKIIADLMNARDKYKKMMLECRKNGDYDGEATYDTYQTAVKVVNNSCYGVLALEKFRMFDAKIADAITTTGQLLIRSTIHLTNKYLNSVSNTENEDYVLTTDTDSVIFTLRGITDEPTTTRDPIKLAQIAEYSKQCQNYINESVYDICKNMFYKYKISKTNNFLTIKNEWLASAGLFVAKKMYVIYMVFNEGIPKEKLKPTGISLKRSSTPAILKPFLEKVINEILSYKTNSEVDTLIIEECEKLKNEYSISDIAIPISLHDLDSYDRIPIHVRGINMWNDYFAPLERDKVNSGKVKYFYVKSWDNNKLNLDKEYVLSVPNVDSCWSLIEGKVTVDYDKMKERLILKPIDAFYSALGWKLPKQTTISHNNIFSDLF